MDVRRSTRKLIIQRSLCLPECSRLTQNGQRVVSELKACKRSWRAQDQDLQLTLSRYDPPVALTARAVQASSTGAAYPFASPVHSAPKQMWTPLVLSTATRLGSSHTVKGMVKSAVESLHRAFSQHLPLVTSSRPSRDPLDIRPTSTAVESSNVEDASSLRSDVTVPPVKLGTQPTHHYLLMVQVGMTALAHRSYGALLQTHTHRRFLISQATHLVSITAMLLTSRKYHKLFSPTQLAFRKLSYRQMRKECTS